MLSIVIPIHNEEPAILPLYDRLTVVLERMEKPYFEYLPDKTEDVVFCDKVRAHGGKIVCNTDIPIGHIGDTIFQVHK